MKRTALRVISALLTFTCGVTVARIPSLFGTTPQRQIAVAELALAVSPRAAVPRVPNEVKLLLDRTFPGWQFPIVNENVRRYLKEYVASDAHPEVITGDFDGDGQMDYAVIIDYWMAAAAQAPPIGSDAGPYSLVLAFLKRERTYEMCRLGDGGEYLSLMKKGARAYDFENHRSFHYPNDAIFAGYFEKGGASHVYEGGSFQEIVTSD